MSKTVYARIVGKFDGSNVNAKGIVELKFKLPYDELVEYINILSMFNNNIVLSTQAPPADEKELGEFRVKHLNIAGDGEAKFSLVTSTEFAEMGNVNDLSRERDKDIIINLSAEIESEDEEDWDEDEQEEEDKSIASEDWQDNESWGDDDENDNDGWD